MIIIFIILILLAIGARLFRIYYNPFSAEKWDWKSKLHIINDSQKNLLNKYFPYYRNLGVKEKERFEYRCSIFLARKLFLNENNHKIESEIELMISASAVQLTFGLDNFLLDHFQKVYVLPGSYRVGDYKTKVRGKTVGGGAIYLSWESFSAGYRNAHDGINAGLHELAHALQIQNQIAHEDRKFLNEFRNWEVLATDVIKLQKVGKENFLKRYNAANSTELFEICVECFFERTEEFRKHLPELFECMKRILNQNPLAEANPILA